MTKNLGGVLLIAFAVAGCEQASQPATGQPPAAGQETTPAAAPAQPPSQSAATAAARPSGSSRAASGSARAAASPAAAAVGEPPAPPKPQFKEVTIPSGTSITVRLETAVASDTSKVEDRVRGTLAKPVVVDGVTAIPDGSSVTGTVTEAVRSGKVKGRASLALRFTSLTARNEAHDITTARISRQAASTKGDDAKKVGIGAGAGALIGAIAGGGKGAAIGGAVGAGAGTGVVMATRGDEVELPAGTTVTTTLQEPLKVLVPID
jgi:hypothetical protein